MSLVNEALKKARAAQPSPSTVNPVKTAAPESRPVKTATHARKRSIITLPFILVMLFVLALAGAMLWAWFGAN
jgi:hypothetical protein